VANDTDRAVHNVYMLTYDPLAQVLSESVSLAIVLHPKSADHAHVTSPSPNRWTRPTAVIFRDADGTWWLRDLLQQNLYRQSAVPWKGHVRRTLRQLEKDRRPPIHWEYSRTRPRAPWQSSHS
jgi:hypothetical protein